MEIKGSFEVQTKKVLNKQQQRAEFKTESPPTNKKIKKKAVNSGQTNKSKEYNDLSPLPLDYGISIQNNIPA